MILNHNLESRNGRAWCKTHNCWLDDCGALLPSDVKPGEILERDGKFYRVTSDYKLKEFRVDDK